MSRPSLVLGVILAVLLLSAGAIILLWPREPLSDVEAVMAVHRELIAAAVDDDPEEVWELLDDAVRVSVDLSFEVWRKNVTDEELRAGGLERSDLPEMDTEAFFVWRWETWAAENPEASREEIRRLREFELRGFELEGGRARIGGDGTPWGIPEMRFEYVRRDGTWRFAWFGWVRMKFKTLEWKVDAFLPKGAVDPMSVGAVVTIGPEGLDGDGARALTARLRGMLPEDAVVVLDVAPRVSWEEVIRARDAILEAGAAHVLHAASTGVPPGTGVRIDGAPLEQGGGEGTDPGPAVERVIRLR